MEFQLRHQLDFCSHFNLLAIHLKRVAMNLITHLPNFEGFDLVFTIINRFSKYVTFIPCKATCTALDLARMFYDHIFYKLSMPQKIVSDR